MANLILPLVGTISTSDSAFEIDVQSGGGVAVLGKSLGGDQGGYGGTGMSGVAEHGGIGASGSVTGLDRDSVGGIGVWGRAEGGVGIYGIGGGSDREGPAVGVEGFGPIGVLGFTNDPAPEEALLMLTPLSGFAFQAFGSVGQNRSSSGWLKAAVYLSGSPTKNISRAFNSQLPSGGAGVASAGISLQRIDRGVYILDFGFQVNDRYVCAMAEPRPSNTNPVDPNSRIPSFDPVNQNFIIVNTFPIAPTQVLVITWAPQGGFFGGGQPIFQGFLPTEANVTVVVF